jgi:hypothetical protein
MEEIIASISRIIAEDGRPGGPPRSPPAEEKDVFELTEAIGEDGSVRRIEPAAASDGPAAKPPEAAKAPPPPTPSPAPRIEPEPPRLDPAVGPGPRPVRERILSTATSEAAAASFARLGTMPPRERPREGELLMGAADRTLEEIVRETLRPLLQAWLDEHLPGIVERLVREEIARVVGEAGIR